LCQEEEEYDIATTESRKKKSQREFMTEEHAFNE
jgi:hypothetical protein